MKTRTTKTCPKCKTGTLWLTLVGEYWDEYECDHCNHKIKVMK